MCVASNLLLINSRLGPCLCVDSLEPWTDLCKSHRPASSNIPSLDYDRTEPYLYGDSTIECELTCKS